MIRFVNPRPIRRYFEPGEGEQDRGENDVSMHLSNNSVDRHSIGALDLLALDAIFKTFVLRH